MNEHGRRVSDVEWFTDTVGVRSQSSSLFSDCFPLPVQFVGFARTCSTFDSARTLIADLPELGRLSHREIASLVGLAPLACDSGTMKGKRMVFGGRAPVRSALYMAAVVGVRHNLVLRAFYQRLRDRGKPPKLALIACAHKLLTILNSMARSGEPWRLEHA